MDKNVHTVLLPLLIINYVFGLRIFKFPVKHQRPWLGIFYMLLLWSIFQFLLMSNIVIRYMHHYNNIHFFLNELFVFKTLLSVVIAVYYDKKFKNCLKKLTTVDATLEKLGIITNYKQLHGKIIWTILKWLAIVVSLSSMQTTFIKKQFEYDTITAIYITLVINHCYHITFIGDLTMMNIIGYVGTKFDQINKHLKNMANNNKYEKTQAWDNTVLRTPRFVKTPSNKWVIWIIIQLHLELRKISHEIDSLYGVEMTIKMGYYFIFMTLDLNNIFHVIFIRNYTNCTVLYTIFVIFWCCYNVLKLIIINLVCEKVSGQANSTKNFLNKLSHSMNDAETCENILQLLLHIKQSPLKFNGIGLFQLGYKFIYKLVASVGTILVILAQAHTESESLFQKI